MSIAGYDDWLNSDNPEDGRLCPRCEAPLDEDAWCEDCEEYAPEQPYEDFPKVRGNYYP